jgi:hypothetical protein
VRMKVGRRDSRGTGLLILTGINGEGFMDLGSIWAWFQMGFFGGLGYLVVVTLYRLVVKG